LMVSEGVSWNGKTDIFYRHTEDKLTTLTSTF